MIFLNFLRNLQMMERSSAFTGEELKRELFFPSIMHKASLVYNLSTLRDFIESFGVYNVELEWNPSHFSVLVDGKMVYRITDGELKKFPDVDQKFYQFIDFLSQKLLNIIYDYSKELGLKTLSYPDVILSEQFIPICFLASMVGYKLF